MSMLIDPGEGVGFGREVLEGRYANYLEVGYNAIEFLLDFGQKYSEQGRMHMRIITFPSYAKEFMRVLARSIEQYEQTVGPIQDYED